MLDRVEQEELDFDRNTSAITSLFEMGAMEFTCLHCQHDFLNKEMSWTHDFDDKGLCKDCFEDDEIREYHLG